MYYLFGDIYFFFNVIHFLGRLLHLNIFREHIAHFSILLVLQKVQSIKIKCMLQTYLYSLSRYYNSTISHSKDLKYVCHSKFSHQTPFQLEKYF